jgi:hypothetical protein
MDQRFSQNVGLPAARGNTDAEEHPAEDRWLLLACCLLPVAWPPVCPTLGRNSGDEYAAATLAMIKTSACANQPRRCAACPAGASRRTKVVSLAGRPGAAGAAGRRPAWRSPATTVDEALRQVSGAEVCSGFMPTGALAREAALGRCTGPAWRTRDQRACSRRQGAEQAGHRLAGARDSIPSR